jgi:hypothetical protein
MPVIIINKPKAKMIIKRAGIFSTSGAKAPFYLWATCGTAEAVPLSKTLQTLWYCGGEADSSAALRNDKSKEREVDSLRE